ncbi:MAG: entericidin A/B family lipoprotein [Nitrosomonas sp.]|nr:entericidin A/B family lipoprotein [Nitrosomonas sp.]
MKMLTLMIALIAAINCLHVTLSGVGKDVEEGGEAIQKSTY